MGDLRWTTVLNYVIAALPERCDAVLVEGSASRSALFAERLRAISGVHVVTDRTHLRPDATIFTVSARGPDGRGGASLVGDGRADAVIDLHDVTWPVLRHLDRAHAEYDHWYNTESRAFFAARAATWDTKFGADLPAYAAAVAEAGLIPGSVTLDAGCGTGRALPALREALGPTGTIIGVDHTAQMIAAATDRARACGATLLLADACRLPLADHSVGAVLAAGLIQHLPNPEIGLTELARITHPGGRLLIFHPTGRAALAARHGRKLRPDEPLAETVLRASAARTGWEVTGYEDGESRFSALAIRR
ncbi:class I SAM-dependent methyltransferase [Actinoplanes sp. TFC3]|uniref:class I SAM-dependent methyltransferase n=1 Tax=Actinoplanes sp. TFC3 TaxID=1710355 RepID=UPI0009E8CC15|nr:class I SAM-dependent methyltransferase [Actinoplanes sp. TFC3]